MFPPAYSPHQDIAPSRVLNWNDSNNDNDRDLADILCRDHILCQSHHELSRQIHQSRTSQVYRSLWWQAAEYRAYLTTFCHRSTGAFHEALLFFLCKNARPNYLG